MRLLVFFLVGGLLGAAAAAALSARLIHWWAVPPFPIGCDVGPAVSWSIARLLLWEGVGALAGAVALAGLYLYLRAARARRRVPPPASPKATA